VPHVLCILAQHRFGDVVTVAVTPCPWKNNDAELHVLPPGKEEKHPSNFKVLTFHKPSQRNLMI
jgi:hypothetical protein